MELTGIGFNTTRHKELITQWICEKEKLEKEIFALIGKELNLNSSKQLGEWLENTLAEKDVEKWLKTDTGQLSTSTQAFKSQEIKHDAFPMIVEYKQLAKRISSFGENIIEFIENDRLYGTFYLGTTATGRMASSHPNMQNMPRDGFRELFQAREGYTFIRLDYSQQELRVAALITKDKQLFHFFWVPEQQLISKMESVHSKLPTGACAYMEDFPEKLKKYVILITVFTPT